MLKMAINKGATGIFVKENLCPEITKRETKMGEIEGNCQPAKFYCSEIKLIYSFVHPVHPAFQFLASADSTAGQCPPMLTTITESLLIRNVIIELEHSI